MKKRQRFVVIGLGKFGFHVAKTLYEEGHEVIAIDRDHDLVQRIDGHCTEAVVLDATDKDKLAALALEEIDAAVVSTGSDTSKSILITLYLNELGVKNILTKAVNEDHGKILSRVGARQIIEPEKSMAVRVAQGLSTPNMIDFLSSGKGLQPAADRTAQNFHRQDLGRAQLASALQRLRHSHQRDGAGQFPPGAASRIQDQGQRLVDCSGQARGR